MSKFILGAISCKFFGHTGPKGTRYRIVDDSSPEFATVFWRCPRCGHESVGDLVKFSLVSDDGFPNHSLSPEGVIGGRHYIMPSFKQPARLKYLAAKDYQSALRK